MPSPLAEFPRFSHLPTEIRLLIWERVEQPTRLVGQVPCSNCFSLFIDLQFPEDGHIAAMQHCQPKSHPDWDLKYIVHPRSSLIFPPLHACHESRAVWLPRFWKPPKYWVEDHAPRLRYYFPVPFISYEKDIFTVFYSLAMSDARQNAQAWEPRRAEVDPFGGLDRKRIHHMGVYESYNWSRVPCIGADIHTLPNLKSLSVICLGPVPQSQESRNHPGELHPLTATQSQYFECHIRDLQVPHFDDLEYRNHIFFNKWRPKRCYFLLQIEIFLLSFDHSFCIWKAWLWHATQRGAVSEGDQYDQWVAFQSFLFEGLRGRRDSVSTPVPCPLNHEGCGPGGHTREEMISWEPPFEVTCKYLCEEGWLDVLDKFSVFGSATPDELEGFKDYILANFPLSRTRR